MNFLTVLLSKIYRAFYADELANEPDTKRDDKLQQLLKLLKRHPNEKLLIFTEFCDTARYLYTRSCSMPISSHLEQIDSRTEGEPRRGYRTLFALL